MKKFLVTIFLCLPLVVKAQEVLTPQQQLEKAQQELEAAKKAVETAKLKAEAARLKAQADSINAATEKSEKETSGPSSAEAGEETEAAADSEDKETVSGSWAIPEAMPLKKAAKKEISKNGQGLELKVDPKYLEGAVTTDADGKIAFSTTTDANGKTAEQIYNIVYAYMNELTQDENQIQSRVAIVNKNEHVIANTMEEWLVFNNSFLSLDRTEFKYNLIATISDNQLTLTLNHISYNYEEGRTTGFKEAAENVITDKVALNKKKTNLARIFGKFRRFTIDRKDQIFGDLTSLVRQ